MTRSVVALLLAFALAGCPEPDCIDCGGQDDDDAFGGDDDDGTDDDDDGTDDDDASDDDDVIEGAAYVLEEGFWEFLADRVVLANDCSLLSNPQNSYGGFDVTSRGDDLYDVGFPDAGVEVQACQVFGTTFGCPPEDRPGAGEIDTELDVEIDVAVRLSGVVESGERMLATVALEFDCDGDACAILETELGAQFPCLFSTAATAAWSEGGDDDDAAPDDDDVAPDDDDVAPDDDDVAPDDDDVAPDDDDVAPDDDDVAPDDDDTTLEGPDIIGLSVDGDSLPTTLEQGQFLDLGYSYSNAGLSDAFLSSASPLINRVHLSVGSTAATSADILAEGERTSDLVAGGSSFLSVSARQILVAPGTYQVVLEVDATDNVAESDETNNEIIAGTLTVVASTVAEDCTNGMDDDFDGDEDCDDSECASAVACEPDLVPLSLDGLSLPITVADGSSITLGYSYQNSGGGATTTISTGTPMNNRIHLSPTTSSADSVAILLSATRTSNLNPGQSSALSSVSVTVNAPVGTWNVLISIDDEDSVPEGDDTNNVLLAGTITITN